VIFTRLFPTWTEDSDPLNVLPFAKIPDTAIRDWKHQWDANQDWRPWDLEVHGQHFRKFTDEEEREIKDRIITEDTAPGKLFTEYTFTEAVREA
jgi:hypothetical protein